VAIGQATLCLLSLSRRVTAFADAAGAMQNNESENATVAPTGAEALRARGAVPASAGRAAVAVSARRGTPPSGPAPAAGVHDALAIRKWEPIAESIVRDGITSKPARLVAAILAQREAGMSPSTIGRTHKVHHTTVGRILSAAEALSA
jgi:hypothetical protein